MKLRALTGIAAACALSFALAGGPGDARAYPGFSPLAVHIPGPDVAKLGGEIPGQGTPAVLIRRTLWVHRTPGGPRLGRLKGKTEFGSRRVLSIVERRGPWVAVLAPEIGNGRVGWLDARQSEKLLRVPYALEVDLDARKLHVRQLGRTLATVPVAIGRPGSPTPLGRFAVTDKLRMDPPGGPYGCCALALTARQPNTPQGWGGGDRVAIHGTPSPETLGQAASAGCIRAPAEAMRTLMDEVALGTPVTVKG